MKVGWVRVRGGDSWGEGGMGEGVWSVQRAQSFTVFSCRDFVDN